LRIENSEGRSQKSGVWSQKKKLRTRLSAGKPRTTRYDIRYTNYEAAGRPKKLQAVVFTAFAKSAKSMPLNSAMSFAV
jgi:hypothetical protein